MNIEICENLPFKDEISSNKDINSMIEQDTKLNNSNKNYIKIFDKNNNLLITKTNKVVQKFRINLLEQLFHSFTITNGDNSLNFSKDWISVFGVGTGGTPPSEGLNPYIVNPKTEDLSEKLLFTDSIFNNVDGNINKPHYWDNHTKKDFTNIALRYNQEKDKVYAILLCDLDFTELLGKKINEIGLYLATHELDSEGKILTKSNFRLFSKVNFSTLPKNILPTEDFYRIVYRVYL